uniref:Exocyst complex component SEC3A n=1 Tax=Rhizophora mucronata TaxID=61149 RepID=A0A2P2MS82_RHIMU
MSQFNIENAQPFIHVINTICCSLNSLQHLFYQRFSFQNGMHISCFKGKKLSFQPFRKCLCFPNSHDISAKKGFHILFLCLGYKFFLNSHLQVTFCHCSCNRPIWLSYLLANHRYVFLQQVKFVKIQNQKSSIMIHGSLDYGILNNCLSKPRKIIKETEFCQDSKD